jgi:hypothetical protein
MAVGVIFHFIGWIPVQNPVQQDQDENTKNSSEAFRSELGPIYGSTFGRIPGLNRAQNKHKISSRKIW